MRGKVLVTPRSFGAADPTVFDTLAAAGLEILRNPDGAILTEERMIQLAADCDGLILGVDPLTPAVLEAAPHLRAVAKYGVGLDNVDLEACRRRGIRVSTTVGANTEAVADFAFTLMLSLARRLIPIDAACRRDDWGKRMALDVSGRTLGLVGLGAIGRAVARRARGFGMHVLAADEVWDDTYADAQGIARADVNTLCREADFISLHVPLLPSTHHMIGWERLALMKPTAILVNTARGGLIDETALLDALRGGRLYGAGLDVFEHEPPEDKGWYTLDNVIMGAHCAASTAGAVAAMGRMSAANLIKDLSESAISTDADSPPAVFRS